MNKKGVTILELLISISLISVVILLLLKVMVSLENINNDTTYASSDEIKRTEIIKEIESELLNKKLNGLNILESKNATKIIFMFDDESKELIIEDQKLTFNDSYTLKTKNASYSKCVDYHYTQLENNYYYVSIIIPVLINGVNTKEIDDITITYLGQINENTSYLLNYTCSKK